MNISNMILNKDKYFCVICGNGFEFEDNAEKCYDRHKKVKHESIK